MALQAQESHATAEKIMAAASSLFAEKGFSNVSIRDICKATGTTAPVLYYYFGSKKGLFDAVARKQISMSDFIARLSKFSDATDPKKGLESLIASYLSYFPEHAFDAGLYMRDSATLDKHSARMVSDDLERVSKIVRGLIARSMAKGQFRETDPDMASDCLLGMLNRVIFQHIHFAKSSDRDSYRRFVTEFFFRAMS
jgi:TetR/AcrR family transcriptional regulator